MARSDPEFQHHMRAAKDAERRIAQDVAAGRQPAKDDQRKVDNHVRQASASA